jgi:thymidylate synthase (FAD)
MKIISPSVEIIYAPSYQDMLSTIEKAGRTCYKSEEKIKDGSAESFIKGILARGHEAVIEHSSITVKFVCDRGVSHEIVRHRLASYCQESTRYCNYSNNKFGKEITVIKPCFWDINGAMYGCWEVACRQAEKAYFELLENGATPQEARSVLPNSLKTEVIMTANVREWRHFLKLRTSEAAHPQMREVAQMLLDIFTKDYPGLFSDIGGTK